MRYDLKPSKQNNFDLIRILAALQVVIAHGIEHLGIEERTLLYLNDRLFVYFPGVPIFFALSGFLIYWSFDRNSSRLKNYFRNRFLRLFPGMWVCLIITIILLVVDAGITLDQFVSSEMIFWVVGQATLFQFYTPDLLRSWAVGTPNGSLWTIVVEIQFYVLTPVLFLLVAKMKKSWPWIIFIFFVCSVVSYAVFNQLSDELLSKKLSKVFILPYLYNFLLGVLVYLFWPRLRAVLEGKFFYWLVFYLLYSGIFSGYLGYYIPTYWPNGFGLVANVLLIGMIFSFAFSYMKLSKVTLKGLDISYGVYIYHALVFNVFISNRWIGSLRFFLVYVFIVLVLGALSWKFVEKPCLNFKRMRIKKVTT